MADPLSLLAIAGLIFAARKCSQVNDVQPEVETYHSKKQPEESEFIDIRDNRSVITNTFSGVSGQDPGLSGHGLRDNGKVEQPSFGDVSFMKHVNGEPVHDFRNRPFVSGKMNNFSSLEKQLVGSGLGVGPDVPAYGGYQQLFRVNPNNVGAYRLTTLPGRSGPAGDISGGRPGVVGQLAHNRPEKTAYMPTRHPEVQGRAQGQGGALTGVVVRGKYEKTKRPTNRSETGLRQDGLSFAPAKKFISNGTLPEEPSRNKGDLNVFQSKYNNNPTPGIANFIGGYQNNPENQYMLNGDKNPQQYGIRETNRRGKQERDGNAGRMNVRADPLNQSGLLTSVRSDCSRVDGRLGPADGERMQNYVQDMYYQFNSYKGNPNPHSTTRELSLAKNQLMANPLAHSISN